MTIKDVKESGGLLFECISGSHAYGLNHAESDIDKRGVFIQPKKVFYGLSTIEQVNDENNDEVYYEIEKFLRLLSKSNPTALEVLMTDKEFIQFEHPIFQMINPADFISKQCFFTFAGFAMSQIKKARGLNKKISNPMDKNRKSILEFCYINKGQGSIPLLNFLDKKHLKQNNCGLVNIAHMKDMYALFYNENGNYKGIVQKENANQLSLSSIPKLEEPIAYLYFNKDGYSAYCKDYNQYWEWVNNRNETRYENTMEHGKNYDAKNMMHTFRLLNTAEEIAETGSFSVKRTKDKDFLWDIRKGNFEYENLLKMAEDKIENLKTLFEKSDLIDIPDENLANELLVTIRKKFY